MSVIFCNHVSLNCKEQHLYTQHNIIVRREDKFQYILLVVNISSVKKYDMKRVIGPFLNLLFLFVSRLKCSVQFLQSESQKMNEGLFLKRQCRYVRLISNLSGNLFIRYLSQVQTHLICLDLLVLLFFLFTSLGSIF